MHTTEVLQRVLGWLAIGDFHHIIWLSNAAACSWAFGCNCGYDQPFFSFNHSAKHAHSHFPQANLDKKAIRAMLWPLGLCVLYYRNTCTHISLSSENTRKKGFSCLESTCSVLGCDYPLPVCGPGLGHNGQGWFVLRSQNPGNWWSQLDCSGKSRSGKIHHCII